MTEVRRRLGGVHVNTVRKLIRRGDLVATRIGSRIMVAESELDDFIERQTTTAPSTS